jgi:transposase
MLIRAIITDGTTADCTKAAELTQEIKAKYLLADKAYDSNEIIKNAEKQGMIPIIPPKSNRKTPRSYDREIYKKRHKIENAFLKMKQWRGIATRYAKNVSSFKAIIQICCIMLCSKIL